MAQSYVGSNNINLLTPSGQYGTRRMGGKDAASPRYIFTMLEKVTRAIFHPEDDDLLNYRNDDGLSIEPEFYVPVIPMVLVNGSDGIGTGWSSKIPNYDPRQIISNIRKLINGEPLEKMHPFYSGFKGKIISCDANKYFVQGIIERVDDTTLVISELPVRTWTQDYKNFIEKLSIPDKNGVIEVKDFTENHTDTTVNFCITADKNKIDKWEASKGGLKEKFKLSNSTTTSNMHLFDKDTKIVKYHSPETILESFFETRMEFYVKRKEFLVKKLQEEQSMFSNKARFVEEICSGDLVVSNRKKVDLLNDLKSRGYDVFDRKAIKNTDDDTEEDDDDTMASNADLSRGYEYLLGMKLWALTFEKAELLRRQLAERTAELEVLKAKKPSQIWEEDLDAISIALNERDNAIAQAEKDEVNPQKKSAQRQKKKAAPKKTKNSSRKPVAAENFNKTVKEITRKGKDMKKRPLVSKTLKSKAFAKPTMVIETKNKESKDEKRKSPVHNNQRRTRTKKIKTGYDDDVFDDEAFEIDPDDDSVGVMEVESVAVPSSDPSGRGRRAVRARKLIKYNYPSEDDDSFMADSDDDDSDF